MPVVVTYAQQIDTREVRMPMSPALKPNPVETLELLELAEKHYCSAKQSLNFECAYKPPSHADAKMPARKSLKAVRLGFVES